MTDQDYIKAAVELADGFKWDEITTLEPTDHSWIKLPRAFGWTEPLWFKWNEQSALDALAAQLVRQVDVLNDYSVETNHICARVVHHRPLSDSFTRQEVGPDRTMNTIKAIVDSGVLK